MDINTSRYWTTCVIANKGYSERQSTVARNFFKNEFPQLSNQATLSKNENQYLTAILCQKFHNAPDFDSRALAGLCLRCYASHAIVKGCQIITRNFPEKALAFQYYDLLPSVLNDDGSTFVVLDRDGKNQLSLKDNGEIKLIAKEAKFVSVEILKTYNPNLSNCESLDNWCIRNIKQNKEIQLILLEVGAWVPSDWSLLCKNVPKSLDFHLKNNAIYFIEVFQTVYRRDRRKFGQTGKCSPPTASQLQEMLCLLREKNIIIPSHDELIKHFQEVAQILRQDMYSTKIGRPVADSIDINSSEDNGDYFSKSNVPHTKYLNVEDVEENEVRDFLNNLPSKVLFQAISERIPQRVAFLQKKKSYCTYAPIFVEGLHLYYRKNNPLSLKEIAERWDINWAKARRIFQFKELIENIQYRSEEIFMSKIEHKLSQNPEDLKNIAGEVRNYLNDLVFKEAFAETTAVRSPCKNSLFAQILLIYIHQRDAA